MKRLCPLFLFQVLLVSCLLTTGMAQAQVHTSNGTFTGFGFFTLGDPIAKFYDSLTLIRGVDTTKKELQPFFYGYKGTHPLPIDSSLVKFRLFMVGFDTTNRLTWIEFLAFYGHPKHASYRQFKKDLSKLVDHYTALAGQPPKKQVYYRYKESLDQGYEWQAGQYLLKIRYEDKRHRKLAHFGISLEKKP